MVTSIGYTTKIIGKQMLKLDLVDSTNQEARRQIAASAGEGLVIVAAEQTAGRGKPGSYWFSPKGNLYFSAVVKPYRHPKDLGAITIIGALAAREAILQQVKLPVVIKWPNDLLIRGKKIAGVLVERLTSGHLIIGIGINVNVNKKRLPKGLLATSLKSETGRSFIVKKLITSLITQLDKVYLEYLQKV